MNLSGLLLFNTFNQMFIFRLCKLDEPATATITNKPPTQWLITTSIYPPVHRSVSWLWFGCSVWVPAFQAAGWLDLAPACRLGSGVLHIFLYVAQAEGAVAVVVRLLMGEFWNGKAKPNYMCTFKALSFDMPLLKASHMVKSNIKGAKK